MKDGAGSAVVVPLAAKSPRDAAIEALFRQHYAAMVRLAYCLLSDRGAAEDAVQEAFVSLHQHWDSVRDRGVVVAYVRSAVFNQCRSRQRRLIHGRRAIAQLAPPEPVRSTEDDAVRSDEVHRLGVAIRQLSPRQREVLVCRFLLGLSEAETSAELDISVGSVKQHTHRARAALQGMMGDPR